MVRAAEAAIADHLRGHTLRNGADGARVDEQRVIRMAVNIDEARCHGFAARVDDFGRLVGDDTYAHDATCGNSHIGVHRRIGRAIEHRSPADEDIESHAQPARRCRSARAAAVPALSTASCPRVDGDSVESPRCFDRDFALAHVLEHPRGIALARAPESAAARRDMPENIAFTQLDRFHRHRRQHALAGGARIQNVGRARARCASVHAIRKMRAPIRTDCADRLRPPAAGTRARRPTRRACAPHRPSRSRSCIRALPAAVPPR